MTILQVQNSNAATWDAVLKTVDAAGKRGVTNSQIAAILNSEMQDVSQLTRLLWKANQIDFRKDGLSNIYTPKSNTKS